MNSGQMHSIIWLRKPIGVTIWNACLCLVGCQVSRPMVTAPEEHYSHPYLISTNNNCV